MKIVGFPTSPGWERIVKLLGPPVLVAFKRGGRWWVVLDGDPVIEMTVEEFIDREAAR